MDYDVFASDLPAARTVFTSAEENEETMRRLGVRQEVRQLGRGRFRCDLAVGGESGIELYADRFNLPLAVRLEPRAGSVTLLLPRSAAGPVRVSGREVGGDAVVFLADGSGADIVAPELTASEALVLPRERFDELARTLYPTLGAYWLDTSTILRGERGPLQEVRRTLLGLLAAPRSAREEDLSVLLGAAVSWMATASSIRRPGRPANAVARSHIARRARDFVDAHHHTAFRLEDLCMDAGVGARTMQRAFREYFDLTISDYLKSVRLAAAHRELLAADPSSGAVTAIAMRRGFPHLGRFSVEFRRRFGESPRETLRRRPKHPLRS